jgi:hypothetical protein
MRRPSQILALAVSDKEIRVTSPAWLWFSARGFKILALSAKNCRNLLMQAHFPHSAFYSAVFQNRLATTG